MNQFIYRYDKTFNAKEKGQSIIQNLEIEKRVVNKFLRTYQPYYDEQKMYERIRDSLEQSIESIKKSIL